MLNFDWAESVIVGMIAELGLDGVTLDPWCKLSLSLS